MNPPAPANPPKSKPSKSLWLLVAAFILVVAVMLWLRRTPPAFSNAPVTHAQPLTARQPSDNAFGYFLRAEDLLQSPPRDAEFTELLSKVRAGSWQQDDRLAKYLERNEPALTELDRGLEKSECKLPDYRNPESPLTYLEPLRDLARLKALRVKHAVAEDRWESAATDVTQIVKFGDMILRGGGPLGPYRMGVAIKHIGYDAAFHLLAQTNLTEATLQQLDRALARYTFDNRALAVSLEVEHRAVGLWLLNAATQPNFDALVVGVSNGEPSDTVRALLSAPPTFRLEITSNLMEQFFAIAQHNATQPWIERQPIEDVLAATLAEPFDLRKEGNARGLIVLHLLFDQVPPTLIHQRHIEAEAIAARAMCALAIYRLRHGSLPESLMDTAPDLPFDPFSNQPLRYSKERGLLWSVGPDRVDDDAKSEYSATSPADFVFRIPFA